MPFWGSDSMRLSKWYKDFRNKYIVQKRRQHEYAINRYYAHLIDPFFTKVVYDLRLTPNIVTIFNGLIGIAAGVSLLTHQLILGGILLQLHHFLDGADGNLARLTNRCTSFGAKLDQISDQIVRLILFLSISYSTDVALWAKIALPLTMLVDLYVVHRFVLPFARNYELKRAKWKQWFLDRGIIPGFDIFTVYFIISVTSICGVLNFAVYFIIILKNLDWIYRVYECMKTFYSSRGRAS